MEICSAHACERFQGNTGYVKFRVEDWDGSGGNTAVLSGVYAQVWEPTTWECVGFRV